MNLHAAEWHEYATAFPMMSKARLEEMADDIKNTCLREPVVLLDGKILDGRNRFRACMLAKVEPRFRTFGDTEGDGDDPLAFVTSKNIQRRDLDESQRGIAAARLMTMKRGGCGSNQYTGAKTSRDVLAELISKADAAKLMGVSTATIERGRVVLTQGTPELIKAVEAGDISVNAAQTIARKPKEEQRQAIAEHFSPKPKKSNRFEELKRMYVDSVHLRTRLQSKFRTWKAEARHELMPAFQHARRAAELYEEAEKEMQKGIEACEQATEKAS